MKLLTARLEIDVPDGSLQPEEVASIFNSNPDFIAHSEGSDEKREYTLREIGSWPPFHGALREHQRFLMLRLRETGELAGVADLLTPQPRAPTVAALGLLILHRKWQGIGLGREAALAIEDRLSREGWTEVELAVLRVRPRSRRFWESCGYRIVREAASESGRECWVMRKQLQSRTH
jgi:GNAT superfamily N-acetyltransferase